MIIFIGFVITIIGFSLTIASIHNELSNKISYSDIKECTITFGDEFRNEKGEAIKPIKYLAIKR